RRTVWSLAVGPEGEVAVGTEDGTLSVRSQAGVERPTRRAHAGAVVACAYSPDGKTLVTSGNDERVRFWRAADGRAGQVFEHPGNQLMGIAFTRDGTMRATGSATTLKLWELSQPEGEPLKAKEVRSIATRAGALTAFSADGKSVVTGGHYTQAGT